MKTRVINLYAGPGASKSTTAAGVFSILKKNGINAELVTEYAKELTWEKRHTTLNNHLYVFAKQCKRMLQLRDQVEVIVTDSPLLLSLLYNTEWDNLNELAWEGYEKFDNIDYFIQRVKAYNPVGRNQTEAEARELDDEILALLDEAMLPYTSVEGNYNADKVIAGRYLKAYHQIDIL